MQVGIILFILGALLALYFSKFKIEKKFLTEIAIIFGIIMALYGLILIVQPEEDKYIKFTQTTIHKEDGK